MKWNQRSKFLFFYISLHALRVCVYPCMCFCLGVCINDSDDNLKAIQWKTNRQKLKPKLLSISLFQTPKVSEPGQEKVWKMSSRLVFFSRPNPKHPKLVGDPPFSFDWFGIGPMDSTSWWNGKLRDCIRICK